MRLRTRPPLLTYLLTAEARYATQKAANQATAGNHGSGPSAGDDHEVVQA